MRKRAATILLTAVGLALLSGCNPATTGTPESTTMEPISLPAEGRAIVLGDISDDPGEVIEGAQPLADYLATRLNDFGITQGQVKVASTPEEMVQWLESGEVDLHFDSVYPAMLISDESGAQPFLRRWRRGVGEYYTVIFAREESGITSLDGLRGHLIALDNPYSTSGFVLPAVYLVEHGLLMVGKESYNELVGDDEVGFVFSYDDENTLQWVLSGLVSAGATDNVHFEEFTPEVRDQLVVLAETEAVPRQVAIARPGIDEALLEAITQILINAHSTEEGRAALQAFDETARFDQFPEGIDAALSRMRELKEIVQDIPLP